MYFCVKQKRKSLIYKNMPKQKTRDELLSEAVQMAEDVKKYQLLAGEVEDKYIQKDLDLRKEFAKAFGWTTQKHPFYSRSIGDFREENKVPTWPEIFVEVGGLLLDRDFRRLKDQNMILSNRNEELENKIRELTE